MSFLQKRIIHTSDWIVRGGIRESHDLEEQGKVSMLHILSWLGIFIMILIGVASLREGNPTVSYFDFSVATTLIFTQVYSRLTGRFTFAMYFGVSCVGTLFLFLLLTGGVNATGHFWTFIFPLLACFLLGYRHGTFATLMLLSSVLLVWAFFSFSPIFYPYSFGFKLRFLSCFAVVFLFAHFFEKFRAKKEKQVREQTACLEKANKELRQEITEREKIEAQLLRAKSAAEAANRAKSEFLATMSHELRTPLNHILGFTELVLGKNFGPLNENQEEYLKDVLHSGNHLLFLVNDILDLSKVEAGKLKLYYSSVPLKEILENSLILIREESIRRQIQVSAETNGIPETLPLDERKFKQILYNLLDNAIKFTPDQGKVLLAAHTVTGEEVKARLRVGPFSSFVEGLKDHPHWLQVCVQDTGIGLAKHNFERIFKIFEQVDGSLNRRYEGAGLGLALAKRLVELHGGKIWVESEGERKGCTFCFIIPA